MVWISSDDGSCHVVFVDIFQTLVLLEQIHLSLQYAEGGICWDIYYIVLYDSFVLDYLLTLVIIFILYSWLSLLFILLSDLYGL